MGHGFADVGQVCQHIIVRVHLHAGQRFLQTPPLGLKHGFPLPEGGHIHVQPIHKVDRAEDKIKIPAAYVLAELFKVIPGHAEFHTSPDLQPWNLQRIIFGVIRSGIEGHIAHGTEGVIVDMIRKADFLQPSVRRCPGHGKACVVPVKGYPGMHMVVVHFYLSQNWRNAVGSAACKLISFSVSHWKLPPHASTSR